MSKGERQNSFAFSLMLMGGLFGLMFQYYEYRHNLPLANFGYQLKLRTPFYKLNYSHTTKLNFRASIMYFLLCRFMVEALVILGTIFGCSISYICFYLYYPDINMILVSLNCMFLIFGSRLFCILCMLGMFEFYIPITFFNYKLDEIVESMRLALRWRNKFIFNKALWDYNKLTQDNSINF